MIDTLVLNAREYKIDGFRFDIMSFQFTLQHAGHPHRPARSDTAERRRGRIEDLPLRRRLQLRRHGQQRRSGPTPTRSISTATASAPSTTASAMASAAAVRLPMSVCRASPPASLTDSSDYTNQSTAQSDQHNTLLLQYSTGSVSASPAICATTRSSTCPAPPSTGSQVDYNGQPTGYTATPIEAVNYCSVHDNQDLFDAVQLKSSCCRHHRHARAPSGARHGPRRARPGRAVLPGRRRPAPLQGHGPEQLRLRRLVQQDRLERRRRQLGHRPAHRQPEPGPMAAHAAAARQRIAQAHTRRPQLHHQLPSRTC